MIALNLLPEVKREYLHTKRVRARVIAIATLVTIVAIALVVVLAAWVYGGQRLQVNYFTTEIGKNEKKLKSIPDIEKYLTIQNQLNNISTLHEGKSDFSRLLDYLPKLVPAGTKLINVEATTGETGSLLGFKGETTDYTSLNTFRDTLKTAKLEFTQGDQKTQELLFPTVTVLSSSLQKSTNAEVKEVVVFEIGMVYSPNAFLFSAKNPTVILKDTNTTPSVQAAPDVFGQSTTEQEGAQ